MTGRIARDITTKARRFLRLALLVPFLLAQLIASGTMAKAGPDGFRMVLCTGDGLVEVIIAADGTIHPTDGENPVQHDPCPWSVTGNHAVFGSDIITLAATPLATDVSFGMQAVPAMHQSRHIRPQTRAPPAAV
ncbi:DUF2946 family protein [Yoonia sp.]|uniref:DUF2946 family protein n=1 Tax=Yoonia sp. TaxID=2212373 RepID=UPI0019DE40E2|nr:DUF2946 family protein [Yoonia sp.]MBE0412970.1 hypothetical protein [Yoonia sp.]